ncbi:MULTISPECIES: hypothetical protein [Lacticaseibacillus]|uniref:Uncharacterized protein n=4 Tax=Lacticaseibacillus TaxID=2759736 RepID=A0A5R8LTE3_LACZE|nr:MULTISPECIES: hypothetical protein [Lacticaseibacillus]OFR91569.1 hypothetical protein HMPREF2861_12490 [Lactobacillus sp. HMSC068F07]KRK10328.1 hypothetical protein FD51_GL001858 [Lacticaseibacillus zeae DSM 20178 = KCTC 3804]MBI6596881.1 hypothetical protein [Lacticaseibacillus casei]MBO1480604.1 hypothetical protein [Lacticaseibacillus casei]MBO2415883.1 hypothetical protein [Lacticaseibacillus casei]
MRKRYRATLRALNSDCIGRQAHGFANFEVTDDDALQIRIEMFNTPADMNHMAVLESTGSDAPVVPATSAQDKNHDGVVDEEEAEQVSGKVFVPLDNAPDKLKLVGSKYPEADDNGFYIYQQRVVVSALRDQLRKRYGRDVLNLDNTVIYVNGVQSDVILPKTVASDLDKSKPYLTLPIAVGKLRKVMG